MWTRIILLCLVMLCADSVVYGQREGDTEKRRYVNPPRENALLVIAAQPDCPLRFEDAKLLVGADGPWWGASYKLRNVGTKPIRALTTVKWTSFGTGGTEHVFRSRAGDLIQPGQEMQFGKAQSEVVPLTDELRTKLGLQGSMNVIVVLMIEKIEFADGSTYLDESTSSALRAYFEQLESRAAP